VLIEPGPLHVDQSNLRAVLDGDDGVLWISILTAALPTLPTRGTVTVGERGEWSAPVAIERTDDGRAALQAIVRVPDVECWWPHTHGPQPLYPVRVSLDVEANPTTVDLGRVGFRDLEIERGGDGDGFGLRVNGVDVFCRGVCWTPLDISALDAGADQYRSALEQLRDAGVNMIRVGGTMVYETDAFYDLCDELGIFVWQDFMFANMDYPSADKAFTAAVSREARQLLRRLQARPSIAVLCGSSEVDQQCAMLGLPAERSKNPLFDELLPALVASFIPDAAWLRSTPSGGTFPFQADRGVSHYYGVGAYLKPFDDARRANVRFASECLAFSNVPDAAMVDRLLAEGAAPGHHPRWKAGVPRDAGAGWDFEDVRDHYLRLLFGLEPAALRANDIDRYLALGRVATAEAMLRTFAEWRRPGSPCRGGLVWFARDLVAGAGWGIVDSEGRPKAAYWYLKRALAPVTLLASDEGLNGLWLHAVNDTGRAVDAEIHVTAYRDGRPRGARASTAVRIPARGARSVHADALFGEGFLDLTYAYRFGPPGHDVVAATLRARATGAILAAAHGFPCGLPAGFDGALRLTARTEPIADGYVVTVGADRFAHAVAIDAEGFEPDDNYFHLEPGQERQIVLHATAPDLPLRGSVRALNGAAAVPITVTASLGVRRAL
jgi:beta-mannosidase